MWDKPGHSPRANSVSIVEETGNKPGELTRSNNIFISEFRVVK